MELVDLNFVNLTPFSLREGGDFKKNLEQLKGILGHRKVKEDNIPDPYYRGVLDEIIHADLSEKHEEKIYTLFKENGLKDDKLEIKILRLIRLYQPQEEGENKLDRVIKMVKKHQIWEKIHPKIQILSPLHHEQIAEQIVSKFNEEPPKLVKPKQEAFKPFSFKEMELALDKDVVFEQKLKQLGGLLGYRITPKSPHFEFYQGVLREIIYADLTEEQEKKIDTLFMKNNLSSDRVDIEVFRLIRRYDPRQENGEDRLNRIIHIILKYPHNDIWEKILPQIKSLSPLHYEQIISKYNESKNYLKTCFDQMLTSLEPWDNSEGTAKAVEILQNFKKEYETFKGYKKLDWEVIYSLIKPRLSFISVEQMKILVKIYTACLDFLYCSPFENLKYTILFHIQNDDNHRRVLFETLIDTFEKEVLKPEEKEEIVELCAWIGLAGEEEKQLLDLLPEKKLKGIFLLNRVKVYCQNLQEKEYWSFDAFKAFLSLICLKNHKEEIESLPFLLSVECITTHLNEERKRKIDEMISKELKFIEWNYKCGVARTHCNALTNSPNQLEVVKEELKALAKAYSSSYRYLHWTYWRALLFHIRSLQLHLDLFLPILEIFKVEKEPRSSMSILTSRGSCYVYGEEKLSFQSTWKGEKYDPFLISFKKWGEVNKGWIEKNLQENKDNSADLIQIVQKLVNFLKELKFSEKEEIGGYNKEMVQAHKDFELLLRDAIKHPKFISAFDRLLDFGPTHTNGCSLIIRAMCDFWFTGMNGSPVVVNLMRKALPFGLEELSRTKEQVHYLAELELFKSKMLTLPLDRQHEAIKGLPEDLKPCFQNLNGLPHRFLSLQYGSKTGEEKKVEFIRSASPTGPNGINHEFNVFQRSERNHPEKRSLFVLLQNGIDSYETKWVNDLIVKKKTVSVVNFPVFDDFYMQGGEFENPELYPTFTSFENYLSTKFLAFNKGLFSKGRVDVNMPGNYLMPISWFDDVKDDLQFCMKQVKDIFFPFTSDLNSSERRIFIRLFHIRFVLHLISYTGATTFGFLCNRPNSNTEVYNTLMVKVLTILFQNKDRIAYGEGDDAFTFEEMGRALVHGEAIKKATNSSQDELTEVLAFLDRPEVQARLVKNKEIFGIQEMAYPDFRIRPIEEK